MVNKISIVGRTAWRFFVPLLCIFVSTNSIAQKHLTLLPNAPRPEPGTIVGTVVDINDDAIPGATVVLQGPALKNPRTLTSNNNGFFEFNGVGPETCRVKVSARGFADWTSPDLALEPGQYLILTVPRLQITTAITSVTVGYAAEQIATRQLKAEENQRIFGIIPNFYVSYENDPAPLTAKMKFKLALKVSTDPVTAAGVLFVASARQAGDTPDYGQGWGAYGKRLGAVTADGLSDIMIGGAVLPSLLHQDPRYFYQGTGTTGSRARHAVLSAFIAKGDNGKWQPNYSTVGGDFAAAGIANLYYPRSDRGVGLVFGNFALGTAERMGANLAEEFILSHVTRRAGHQE
ncbi:MAG: carboxypeptidase-like regulatory domain-containing protein [Candidatus Sulfotelmatobacter sp.]